MEIRRYRAYTTLTQVRKKLGMGNKNTLKVVDGVFQPSRQITIKKNPKYIAITMKAERSEIDESEELLKGLLGEDLISPALKDFRNRLDALLKVQPKSKFLNSVRETVQEGEWPHTSAIEIVEEIEAKRQNPDLEILRKIDQAISLQPRSRYFQDLRKQVTSGFDLSSKQIAVIEKTINPPVDQDLLDRLEGILSARPSTFIESLIDQVRAGRKLSPKQMDIVQNMEGGNAPAVQNPQSVQLLQELLDNGYLNSGDRKFVYQAMKHIGSGGNLSDNDRKKIRHLLYKNTNRMNVQGDIKDLARKVFKKARSIRADLL